MRDTAIIDIDGVLSDHWDQIRTAYREINRKGLRPEEFDWSQFALDSVDNPPIEHGIELTKELEKLPLKLVFVTGRREIARNSTRRWLIGHGFQEPRLYMRPNDYRGTDVDFKECVLLQKVTLSSVYIALEDRGSVIDMYHRHGVTVLPFPDKFKYEETRI